MEKFDFKHNGQYQFEDGAGVYAIVNLLNNKKYIGSTGTLRKRYRQHYNNLCKLKHPNIILLRAYNKYGSKHFAFIVLERCEDIVDTLLQIEQKYIDEFGDYNICKQAGTTRGVSHIQPPMSEEGRRKIAEANRNRVWRPETLKKMSESSKNNSWNKKQRKPVLQYDLNDNFILEYPSVTDAAKSVGGGNRRICIKDCCKGKHKSAYNFKWKYKNDIQNDLQQSCIGKGYIRLAA